ncbi:BTAD domain-containing putative transcriptional regulator [Actinosynnema sp. NPDC050801]
MEVRFRLLGPVEVHVDGRRLDIGHARQRHVLAALLVDLNRAVSLDQLVDRLWDAPPRTARDSLYSYLSRLRAVLGAVDDVDLVRRGGGYVLVGDEDAVDLHGFRGLVARARAADDERAVGLFDQALGLWRGPVAGEMDSSWIDGVRARADEERLLAELDRNDVLLRRGEHAAAVAGIAAQAADRPLDERLAGQLMLALYRSGRQGEALDAYRRVQRRLVEELGADPSPPLRRLHQRILTADPVLGGHAPADLALGGHAPADLAFGGHAPAAPAPSRSTAPVPRQLPLPPPLFTGRTAELTWLDRAVPASSAPDRRSAVVAISGPGGVGKTSLALHWAHRDARRFPDGQLYANLRGFTPSGTPSSSPAVIRVFLQALGVDTDAIPPDDEARIGLYRSLTADKQLLVLLDNARDSEHVADLVPGGQACTVVVTSRRHLTGLVTTHGARQLTLDVLPAAEARDLLVRHIGPERADREGHEVPALAERSAGLPLAISVIGARAAVRADLPLAELARELDNAAAPLDAFEAGEITASVRAVFASSYRALPDGAARAFRLLSAGSPEIGLAAVAALLGVAPSRARVELTELCQANLLHEHVPDRFRMHDLVRLYADERARHDEPAESLVPAVRRLVDHYLHTALAAQQHMDHSGAVLVLSPAVPGSGPLSFDTDKAAMTWYDEEHQVILDTQRTAARYGWDLQVWQFAEVLRSYQLRRPPDPADGRATWEQALGAAERLGDRRLAAKCHRFLGHIAARHDFGPQAIEHLRQAVGLLEDSGDELEQARTHLAFAWVLERHGDDAAALDHSLAALPLFRSSGSRPGEADALNAVGWYQSRLGRLDEAAEHCGLALALYRESGDRNGEANTLESLGFIAHNAGRHDIAIDHYEQALRLFREDESAYQEADTLVRMADAHLARGAHCEARRTWEAALVLLHRQSRSLEAADVERSLRSLPPP